MRKSTLAAQLMRSTVLTGAAVAFVTPAFAQEEEDEIVVTGSRIAREDLAAPSPVASFDSQQLVLNNTVNTEEFLDALPQVIPSFDSSSNNPGTGRRPSIFAALARSGRWCLSTGCGSSAPAPARPDRRST